MDTVLNNLGAILSLVAVVAAAYINFKKDRKGQQETARTADKAQRDTALGKAAEIALQAVEPFQAVVAEQNERIKEMQATMHAMDLKNASIVYNLQVIVQGLVLLVQRLDEGPDSVDKDEKTRILAEAQAAIRDMRKPQDGEV